jgi:membrane dipeptidase
MGEMAGQRVFDGHNDILSCLLHEGDPTGASFFSGREGDLDLAKCRAGGFAGGFFAVWCSNGAGGPDPMAKRREFPAIDAGRAHVETAQQIAVLLRMERAQPEAIRLCRSVAEIEAANAAGALAALLHIEGCEGIGAGLDELHLYHAAGLRSLGPVWSRPNIFGHGVPFDFPASPDTGPGLTAAGKALLAECETLGILFDLSHLNEAGFWDVARLSNRPLIATHSNAHAVTASTRNLTDKQLAAVAESGGLVGINFGCQFLRADGVKISATEPAELLRHLEHLLQHLGEDGVALGSDFDGAMMPDFIGSAAGLPKLIAAMQGAGYGADLIDKICWQNWMRALKRSIG